MQHWGIGRKKACSISVYDASLRESHWPEESLMTD